MDKELEIILNPYVASLPKKEVVGVVLTGSAGRGDMDAYSDVDIVVFVDKRDAGIQEGKFGFNGWLLDVRVSIFDISQTTTWSLDENFAYLNARIIHDPNGQVARLLQTKRQDWIATIPQRIILLIVQLSVILEFKDNWRGLKADTHYLKFMSRNDWLSAHRTLNLGFDIILDLLYLLKECPVPDYKNKIRLLKRTLSPTPEILSKIEEFAQIASDGLHEAERKYEILAYLAETIRNSSIFSSNEFPEDFYRYYLEYRV